MRQATRYRRRRKEKLLGRAKTCHRQLFARPSVFLRYFLHAAKSTNPFPLREVRGFPNLDSVRRSRGFARTKLKPFPKGDSWFCKPRISTHKKQIRTNPIKSFCRSAAFPPPLAASFFVAAATNLCASRYYRRLRRLRNFPFGKLSLPGRHTPCAFSPPLAAIFSACGGVPLREHSRFCKPRFSAPQPRCAFSMAATLY